MRNASFLGGRKSRESWRERESCRSIAHLQRPAVGLIRTSLPQSMLIHYMYQRGDRVPQRRYVWHQTQISFYARRYPSAVYQFYDCGKRTRCKGGTLQDPCDGLWEGDLCATCAEGRTILKKGKQCAECEGGTAGGIMTIIFLFFCSMITYIPYRTSFANRAALGKMAIAMSFGMILQTTQLLAVMGKFSFEWPEPLASLMGVSRFLEFDFGEIGYRFRFQEHPHVKF